MADTGREMNGGESILDSLPHVLELLCPPMMFNFCFLVVLAVYNDSDRVG